MLLDQVEAALMVNIEDFGENYKYLNPFLVADLIGFPIHIIDHRGIVVFVSKAWVQRYKTEPSNAVGIHINDLINTLMPELDYSFEISSENNVLLDVNPNINSCQQPVKEPPALIAQRERRQVTLLVREKNGHLTSCQSSPIYDGHGNVIYVLTIFNNISIFSDWLLRIENLSSYRGEPMPNTVDSGDYFPSLIGKSGQMVTIKHLLGLASKTDATVLLTGESGSGKEIAAKEIHFHSHRRDKPYIAVNCSAIPKELIESELFGFEKGAFTGAYRSHKGVFEQADGGTLLLDEIGEMPLPLQTKLLRVLQEFYIKRIGGSEKIPINVRVIASTNKKMQKEIQDGNFRADLFYRLNVFPIEIPPLRARGSDIPLLANYFLTKCNARYNTQKALSAQALHTLQNYDWPGNARELENFIERLVIMTPETENEISSARVFSMMNIPDDDLSALHGQKSQESSLKEAVRNYERMLISHAMQKYKSTHKTAKALQTSQPTIVRKMHQLGIKDLN
jgi:transcriptional regulator with PAS, ATPase and Fis domain